MLFIGTRFSNIYTAVNCLMVSAANGHLDVVKDLLEGGGRKLLVVISGPFF